MATLILTATFKNGSAGLLSLETKNFEWIQFGLDMPEIAKDELPERITRLELHSGKGSTDLEIVPGLVSSMRWHRE